MTRRVFLRLEAERDLADAAAWYEEQRSGLGHQFLDEVAAGFVTISEAPFRYPVVHRDTRRAFLRRFPFGIYFRIVGEELVVVAVMHGSRNPRRWKRRR